MSIVTVCSQLNISGLKLEDLEDVQVAGSPAPQDGDVLTFNAGSPPYWSAEPVSVDMPTFAVGVGDLDSKLADSTLHYIDTQFGSYRFSLFVGTEFTPPSGTQGTFVGSISTGFNSPYTTASDRPNNFVVGSGDLFFADNYYNSFGTTTGSQLTLKGGDVWSNSFGWGAYGGSITFYPADMQNNSPYLGDGGDITIKGGDTFIGTGGNVEINGGLSYSGRNGDISLNSAGIVLDGTVGITNLNNAIALKPTIIPSLTVGFSVTIPNNTSMVILVPTASLALGTVTLPPNPLHGQILKVTSGDIVAALTVSPNSGQSIVGAPNTITPTQPFSLIYENGASTWYRI